MYRLFFKRFFDLILSSIAFIVLFPLLFVLMIIGTISMKGNPFFVQKRPGKMKNGKEKIFNLIKFRSMTNEKDSNGELLPDDLRLKKYGKLLRSTSLDELPSLINIIIGDMSIVGPRPQLVRDMVFMDDNQRRRHIVRPGLTGLAQVNGRNNITWEQKFTYDLEYIDSISLINDIKIIFKTVGKVLKRSDIVRKGTSSDLDFGDCLLQEGKVTRQDYDDKQVEARKILGFKYES